ncbi:MAG: hypothetical protein RL226_2155 [Bacteroidota bacterium]
MKDLGAAIIAITLLTTAFYAGGVLGIPGTHDHSDHLHEDFILFVIAYNCLIVYLKNFLFAPRQTVTSVLDSEATVQMNGEHKSGIWMSLIHPLGLLVSVTIFTYILMYFINDVGGSYVRAAIGDPVNTLYPALAAVAVLLSSIYHVYYLRTT